MSRKLGLIALLLVLALVAAACGDDTATTTTAAGSTTTGASLTGSIAISGSSTVEPISAGVAELFNAMHPDVAIQVEGPGTGDGAQLFCTGQIDIGDASRPYKDAEKELCAENGIEFIELVVAIDGLSVLTSPDNDAFSCLATPDLYALMGPESLGFGSWADANDLAAEIGAPNAPYPDADLVITAPGEESGTYDSFVEFAIKGIAEERDQNDELQPDYVASPNDNVIIEGIAGSPTSLGFVGYAFYLANQDRVKALAIDDGDGCVAPTAATIADGSYPYSRLPVHLRQPGRRPRGPRSPPTSISTSPSRACRSTDRTGYVRLADYAPTLEAWQNR